MSPADRSGEPRRTRFGLGLLLFGVTVVALALAYPLAVKRQIRNRAAMQRTHAQFVATLYVLRHYNSVHARLPDPSMADAQHDGELRSWRSAVTDYVLTQDGLSLGVESMPASTGPAATDRLLFARGRTPGADRHGDDTVLFAITGPGTAWGDGGNAPTYSLDDVPDDAILVVEVRDSGSHWSDPVDFDIRTMPRTLNAPDGRGISSPIREGFYVGFADGDVWFLANEAGFERLATFFTIEGAREHDRYKELGPFRLDAPR